MKAARILWISVLGSVSTGWAHQGAPLAPHDLWRAWNWEPSVLLGLALTAFLYCLGIGRLWRRAGRGRGIRPWQVTAFWGGHVALFIALVSPLDALSSSLFSAHMVQHLLLILVAAPLLVLSTPGFALLWALPLKWRRAAGRFWTGARRLPALWHVLSAPLLVWLLYTLTLWVWHLPGLYETALRQEPVHALEHLSFLVASCLFWWTLFQPFGRKRLGRGAAALYLFATSLQGSALGVLITLAPRPWYAHYTTRTTAWGLGPLQDQQLAGLIMWMPVGMLYVVLAAVLVGLWLKEAGEADARVGRQTNKAASPPRKRPDYPLVRKGGA